MANWRGEMQHLGGDLCGGGQSLLDLRFADDILLFGTDYHVIGVLVRKLVENLAARGLQLNAILLFGTDYHVIGVLVRKLVENLAARGLQLNAKKKILTTQAQPPSQLQTPNGLIISVLDRESTP